MYPDSVRVPVVITEKPKAGPVAVPSKNVGTSPAWLLACKMALLAGKTSSNVAINGETGTGKEHLARRIHDSSSREGEFVAVNCAAFQTTTFESQFFGSRKGGFTDAIDKKGFVEHSDGGTLFLDEVGDLPLEAQAKLLRVIQEGEVTPVGGLLGKKVDLRVVSATNRDLGKMVKEGSFRRDLFFRLVVLRITTPTVAERQEDIIPLLQHFMDMLNFKHSFTEEEISLLKEYSWPGNVREIGNFAETLSAFGSILDVKSILLQFNAVNASSAPDPSPKRQEKCSKCNLPGVVAEIDGEGKPICRKCYLRAYNKDPANQEECSVCHNPKPVGARTADDKPICRNCLRNDPAKHEECSICHQVRAVGARDQFKRPVCANCRKKSRKNEEAVA